MLVWAFIFIMALIIIALALKIYMMKKSAKEISYAIKDKLITNTNTLISISSSDKTMRQLAQSLNKELKELRTLRHRYQEGDIELKNAITNISHDLRTPLTAINGYLDLLEEEEKSEKVEKYFEIIKNRTKALEELTNDLFKYSIVFSSRLSSFEPTSLNKVLEESIIDHYAVLKEKGIEPKIEITEKEIIRNLSPSSLSRVFSNLINNALKYSDGNLSITLDENGLITFKNKASSLNEVDVGKLFNRFYTVQSGKESTGLGLSIAKKLVEEMNGKIEAKNENGELVIYILFNGDNHKM